MFKTARFAYDSLLDLSADELLGALLVCAVMAMILAGVFALARKRTADSPGLVAGLVLAACVVSMTLSLGYSTRRIQEQVPNSPNEPSRPQPRAPGPSAWTRMPMFFPRPSMHMGSLLSRMIMDAFDADHDNHLTRDEVALALAGILTDNEGGERSSIERGDLEIMINRRLQKTETERAGQASQPPAWPPVGPPVAHSSSSSSPRSG